MGNLILEVMQPLDFAFGPDQQFIIRPLLADSQPRNEVARSPSFRAWFHSICTPTSSPDAGWGGEFSQVFPPALLRSGGIKSVWQ